MAATPLPRAERSLAPDLARGAVLLFIALANVVSYLYGRDISGVGWRAVDGDRVDRAADLLVDLFVAERSFPMFAILLGYGLATIMRRLDDDGLAPRDVRRVLVRRNLALIAIGAIHTALLFNGDILALYGLTGLVALLLLRRGTAVKVGWASLSLILLTARSSSRITTGTFSNPGVSPDYLLAARQRLADWAIGSLVDTAGLLMLGLVLIGAHLSATGMLDRPWEHVRLLRRLAVAGLAANLVLNLPHATATALLWWPDRPTAQVITALHALSGVPTGLAYLCLFALLAARLRDRTPGRLRAAVSAVGERSMTCYLLQSVVLAPLLSPWGLGLGGRLGSAGAYLVATAAWAVAVGAAVLLARRGRRGPAEAVLRRFAYGRFTYGRFTHGWSAAASRPADVHSGASRATLRREEPLKESVHTATKSGSSAPNSPARPLIAGQTMADIAHGSDYGPTA